MSQSRPTDAQATAYAENYVLYGDQSRAFRVAFPGSKGKPESIHQKASVFHKLVKVQSMIAELRVVMQKQSEEEFCITVSTLKESLVKAIKRGLDDKVDQQGNQVPISIPGAVSAIAEINKMDGNHAAVKSDLSSSDGTMTPKGFNDFYADKAKP
jgi:hypothetical protein